MINSRKTPLHVALPTTVDDLALPAVGGGAGSYVEYTDTSVEEYKWDDQGNVQHSKAESGTQTKDEKGNVTVNGPTHSIGTDTSIPNGTFGPG